MIEADLKIVLESDSEIIAVVGSRIHHRRRPEGETGACIVYQRVATVPSNAINGFAGKDTVRMQIATIADVAGDALELAYLVRAAINRSALVGVCVSGPIDSGLDDIDQPRYLTDFNLRQSGA